MCADRLYHDPAGTKLQTINIRLVVDVALLKKKKKEKQHLFLSDVTQIQRADKLLRSCFEREFNFQRPQGLVSFTSLHLCTPWQPASVFIPLSLASSPRYH